MLAFFFTLSYSLPTNIWAIMFMWPPLICIVITGAVCAYNVCGIVWYCFEYFCDISLDDLKFWKDNDTVNYVPKKKHKNRDPIVRTVVNWGKTGDLRYKETRTETFTFEGEQVNCQVEIKRKFYD